MIFKALVQKFTLVLLSLGLLSGCNKSTDNDKTVTINIGFDPPTLSSQAATKVAVIEVIYNLSEGLTRINRKGEVEPGLAEKITVFDDGLRYQFTIKKDATWSSGVPVKAQDFARSFNQILTKKVIAPMGDQLFTIKNARPVFQGKMAESALGVRVLSDNELEIELEGFNPVFLYQLSTPIFFPVPENYSPDTPSKVSCGPYFLKEWQREKHLVLEKNPHYWDAENIKIPRFVFTTIGDAHTQLAMFQEGQLDWCGAPFLDIPEEAIAEYEAKNKLRRLQEASVHMVVFNTKKGIFQNLKMRRAFGLAIDRPNLVKHSIFTGKPAASFVPPSIIGQDNPYFPYYAPEEAKELLKLGSQELSIQPNALPRIRFVYFNKAPFPRRAQAIQANWLKLFGVQVELIGLEWQMYVQTLKNGEFDVAIANWMADFPDPINFLNLYRDADGGRNYPAWENGRYQHQLELATRSPSMAQRKYHYLEAEKILLDEMVIAPISFPATPYLCSERLKGDYANPMGIIDFRGAYIEE